MSWDFASLCLGHKKFESCSIHWTYYTEVQIEWFKEWASVCTHLWQYAAMHVATCLSGVTSHKDASPPMEEPSGIWGSVSCTRTQEGAGDETSGPLSIFGQLGLLLVYWSISISIHIGTVCKGRVKFLVFVHIIGIINLNKLSVSLGFGHCKGLVNTTWWFIWWFESKIFTFFEPIECLSLFIKTNMFYSSRCKFICHFIDWILWYLFFSLQTYQRTDCLMSP